MLYKTAVARCSRLYGSIFGPSCDGFYSLGTDFDHQRLSRLGSRDPTVSPNYVQIFISPSSIFSFDVDFSREIKCGSEAFVSASHRNALASFPHLRAISIDSHEDIRCDAANQFSYRNLVDFLPPSLRYLEIKHAHSPDINVISMIKKCCPELEHLWLGRCTMFNRVPACHFWKSFPFDHDSYISIEGTDAYTHSLGQELAPLRRLKTIRLGVYLMPSSAVLAHRAFHVRNLPAPEVIDWQQAVPLAIARTSDEILPRPTGIPELVSVLHRTPEEDFGPDSCSFCKEQSYQATQEAEKRASQILKEVVPSLECVEWMNWFTPRHLGISSSWYKPDNAVK
ncbi:hypothetical protein BDV93DRAFT_294798 [Ceratobasidium sp. AG-I]|nr:hypothetical protein BDV93DRAFT_294798 [Ceratobasidium sp. AG-I]